MKKTFQILTAVALLAASSLAAAANSATITWDNNAAAIAEMKTGNITATNIYRAQAACPAAGVPAAGSKVGSVVADQLKASQSFTDTANLLDGQTYCWWATFAGPGGEGGVSNTGGKSFPFAAPGATPQGVRVQ